MSTLSPREQELYKVALSALPEWYSADENDPKSTIGGFAKMFGAAWDQIDAWVDIIYIKKAFGMWLDAHARDRGTRRQANEGDGALQARLRSPADALTKPALQQIADAILAGSGIAGTATIIEGRVAAGAYWQDPSTADLQDFWGDGHRWENNPHDLYVLLPATTDSGTEDAVAEAMRLFAAGGVDIFIEVATTWSGQQVTITPPAARVQTGVSATVQFTAQTRLADTVTWKVNGVAGGNSTFGTISAGGLYTPPATPPFPEDVEIEAVSALDSTIVGTARCKVFNLTPITLGSVYTADSPWLWWRLGAASYTGATEGDASGNGRTGTIAGSFFQYTAPGGPTYLAPDNQGFTDFTNGNLSSALTPPTGGGFTCEAWVSKDFAIGAWIGDTGQHFFMKVSFSTGDLSAGFDTSSFAFGTIGNIQWGTGGHHLVFTWDGTTGKFYLDGTLMGSQAMSAPGDSLANFEINPLHNSNWGSSIAELAVYTTALSAAKVTRHYLAGTGQLFS